MRGTKRPIEGQVVDSGEPAYYVEAMPRWRRVLAWSERTGVFYWVAAVVLVVPILIWRLPAVLFIAGLTIGWYLGWYTAKGYIEKDGELPPL